MKKVLQKTSVEVKVPKKKDYVHPILGKPSVVLKGGQLREVRVDSEAIKKNSSVCMLRATDGYCRECDAEAVAAIIVIEPNGAQKRLRAIEVLNDGESKTELRQSQHSTKVPVEVNTCGGTVAVDPFGQTTSVRLFTTATLYGWA